MFDVDKVATRIDEEADDNAIIILGASIKEDLNDEIAVTVIAAGFEKPQNVDILN
ncbi:MAG: cell division protein FtsZ, partial [Anaerovoracaceae bacterium]